MSARRRASGGLHVALLCAVAACAGGGGLRVSDITPQSIPTLEAERAARPQDASVLARLGVAYFKASRFADARQALDSAVARDPGNGIAAVYLGMTAEELGDFTVARAAYQRYLEVGRSEEIRQTARRRLSVIGRREMVHQARQALAREAELAELPPEANTVAVMPFSYTGANEEVRPLGRGFAQLVVTDLAKSRQIRVLERERMQAILDELGLAETGRADTATALRGGRLLRAARVVQGTLADRPDDELRVDAAVVDVASAGVAASAGASDALRRLFDLEKQLVLSIFENLGIQLTPAEQEAINQRPTENLQAFLAYSRGLEADDRGDFQAAQQAFNEAVTLDPSFRAASQSATTATDLSVAAAQTTQEVEAVVVQHEREEAPAATVSEESRRGALRDAANNVAPTQTAQTQREQEQQQAPSTPPGQRDTTAETTNTEGPRPTTGTIVIIVRRPQ